MYHPKFSTYMERSETLNKLISGKPEERFPAPFKEFAPKNAEDLIVWCLERDPAKRPSAEELLKVSMHCLFYFLFILQSHYSHFETIACHRVTYSLGKLKLNSGICKVR